MHTVQKSKKSDIISGFYRQNNENNRQKLENNRKIFIFDFFSFFSFPINKDHQTTHADQVWLKSKQYCGIYKGKQFKQ